MLADEPTGNLDSRSEAEVLAILAAVHDRGATIVMVTHSDAAAASATRTVEVRDGEISE